MAPSTWSPFITRCRSVFLATVSSPLICAHYCAGVCRATSQNLIEKAARALLARPSQQLRRRSVFDDKTCIGEINVVGDLAGKAHLVRDENASHAFRRELADGEQ